MNKIAKIGLTALAGSLVATSAFAGAMSVSGSAKVSYVGGKGDSAANPASNSKGISFSGSGELDNGFTVSTGYTMTNAAFSSTYVSLDMGDSGTLHFMNGTSKAGIQKYQDMMPTAGEQVWDDVDTDDNGVVGTGNANTFGYEVSLEILHNRMYLRYQYQLHHYHQCQHHPKLAHQQLASYLDTFEYQLYLYHS